MASGGLASHGLGESERGMLHYYAGIKTVRIEVNNNASCDLVLVQGVKNAPLSWWAQHGWETRWQGSRPGEKREQFLLLARPGGGAR